MEETFLKSCKKCGAELKGQGGRCLVCRREYHAKNAAKINAKKAEFRSANPEKTRAERAAYWVANAERIKAARAADSKRLKEYKATYYAANAERLKAQQTAYNAKNPDRRRSAWQNRRSRKLQSGGVLSNGLAGRLFELQRGKCACCRCDIRNGYHLDHIMPLSLGGPNADENMQLLCPQCNMQKSAKHPIEFMQQRGFLL